MSEALSQQSPLSVEAIQQKVETYPDDVFCLRMIMPAVVRRNLDTLESSDRVALLEAGYDLAQVDPEQTLGCTFPGCGAYCHVVRAGDGIEVRDDEAFDGLYLPANACDEGSNPYY